MAAAAAMAPVSAVGSAASEVDAAGVSRAGFVFGFRPPVRRARRRPTTLAAARGGRGSSTLEGRNPGKEAATGGPAPADQTGRGGPRMVPVEQLVRTRETPGAHGGYATNGRSARHDHDHAVGSGNGKAAAARRVRPNGAAVDRNDDPGVAPAPAPGTSLRTAPTPPGTTGRRSGGVLAGVHGGLQAARRTAEIWAFLAALKLRVMYDSDDWAYAIDGGYTVEKQRARRQRTASWLRKQLLRLGPTFIKFGQFFSTRSDLLPKEYVHELSMLQDKVPAFSHETARRFIEAELGAPIDVLFREFEDRPLAAASLGQVHRAILHNGEKVVVKVQRPGLRELFDVDLSNMRLVAEYFQSREPIGGHQRNWMAIYNDCSEHLYMEIDYINEGKSADRFRRDFRNVKWVNAPLVFWEFTTMKVLTLEYIPGIKINDLETLDAKGFNRSEIASSAIESYLMQILKTGFFHADPHPGNLAVDSDGSLIYYDFGMMGEIKPYTRERLLELFFAIYENDVKKVMRSLITLEVVQPTDDLVAVQRSIRFLMNAVVNQKGAGYETLSVVREDLLGVARDQPIYFPSTFIFVLKAFTTIEGIGYTLDPEFSFAKCAAPYVQELVSTRHKQRGAELVDDIRKQANDVGNYALSMPYRIQQIEDFTKQLESGDLKLRVRALESERAAKKATILQIATMYTVLSGILLNGGVTLTSLGLGSIANGAFIGSGIFFIMIIRSMQQVKQLDRFDRNI